MRTGPLHFVVFCTIVALACGGDGDIRELASGSEDDPATASDQEWPCERRGYPCTWAEVDADIAERSRALGEEALDRFEPGGAAEVVAWLEAHPGVEEAEAEEPTVVRFRLEDGRPVYIENHVTGISTASWRREAQATSRTLPPPIALARATDPFSPIWEALVDRASPAPSPGVTGRDRNSDERVNQRDHRRALILEPMLWEQCYGDLHARWIHRGRGEGTLGQRREMAARVCFGDRGREGLIGLDMDQGIENPRRQGYEYESEGARIRDILEALPPYRGNVRYLTNEEVTLEAFEGWDEYDVIHVNSHGSRGSITLGPFVNWGRGSRPRGPLARRRGVSPWLADVWDVEGAPRRWVWSGNRRFFRALYPQGLERTLISTSTCNTLGHPRRAIPPLADQILGRQSMLIGWGGSVEGGIATDTAVALYRWLADGWSGEEALRRVPVLDDREHGEPVFVADPSGDCEPYEDLSEERSRALALVEGITMEELEAMGGPEALCRKQNEDLMNRWGHVLGSRGDDMRIREIVRLLHPRATSDGPDMAGPGYDQAPLRDGEDLARLLVGAPGDGEDDRLRAMVEVEAIRPGEADETKIQLELDGEPIGDPKTAADGEPVLADVPVDAERGTDDDARLDVPLYRVDFENVPVGEDIESGREYELEAVVSLPEGGESRYAARLTTEVCRSRRQGDVAGNLGGGNARKVERRDAGNFAKLFLAGPGRPSRLQIEAGRRRDFRLNVNVPIERPPEAGSRFLIQDPAIEVVELGGGLSIRGAGYGGRRDLSLGWHVGTVRVSIDQVNWREGIPDHANLRGWACGEIDADLVGYGPPMPGSTTPVQVPHTFKARFWAELTTRADTR